MVETQLCALAVWHFSSPITTPKLGTSHPHRASSTAAKTASKELPELWERAWMRTLGVETLTEDFPGVEPHASLGREGRGWLILTNPTLLWPQMSSRREALWFRVSADAGWAGATGPGVSAVFIYEPTVGWGPELLGRPPLHIPGLAALSGSRCLVRPRRSGADLTPGRQW